ncbi:hypothetical protein [Clostridioides difficile]|uniref:hypothetical protein n=1 Tax=Clostridioides difficile TaxID=1496 RepID=UPI000D1DDB71|nr:hypothetical protein [Clostridioides difficile]HBE9444510.1 hypothetical protein [Clostridioides difficile]
MKKSQGIIISIILLLITIGIYFLSSNINKKEISNESKNKIEVKKTQPQNDTDININKENRTSNKNEIDSNNIEEPLVQTSSIKEVSNDILQYFNAPKTEIMIVSKKKVMLADLDKSSKSGKQILFALELLNSDNETISLYVNQNIYNTISIGNKLNVLYSIYINDNGIKIPFLNEVTKIVE